MQRVEVVGGAPREVRVDVDPAGWRASALRWTTSPKRCRDANVLESVGLVQDRHKLLLTLADNQLKTVEDVRNIVLHTAPAAGANGASAGPGGAISLSTRMS